MIFTTIRPGKVQIQKNGMIIGIIICWAFCGHFLDVVLHITKPVDLTIEEQEKITYHMKDFRDFLK